jgi:hypothetical protein
LGTRTYACGFARSPKLNQAILGIQQMTSFPIEQRPPANIAQTGCIKTCLDVIRTILGVLYRQMTELEEEQGCLRQILGHMQTYLRQETSDAQDEGSETSGEGSETSGEGSETSGEGSETSGEGSETSGEGSETSGEGSETSGEGSETSGEGSETEGEEGWLCFCTQDVDSPRGCSPRLAASASRDQGMIRDTRVVSNGVRPHGRVYEIAADRRAWRREN